MPCCKLLVLLPYLRDTAPGQRFRWEQWIKLFPSAQVKVNTLYFETEALADVRSQKKTTLVVVLYLVRYLQYFAALLLRMGQSDVVVVYRNAVIGGPPLVETLLFLFRKKIIYDFDDAIFLSPTNDKSLVKRLLRCDWKVSYICSIASMVGVGNEFLAAYAGRYNKHVNIWPTSIDTEWSCPGGPRSGMLTVGWTGSASTASYLEEILPEIADLQRDYTFRLLVVGGKLDLDSYGINGECRPWTARDEVACLQEMDIGLMPLLDTPWENGKCSLKALQYQSVAIPAVASDVGMNRKAVLDGKTGFLVPPRGDWSRPLAKLLVDPELRRRMGAAARVHVERNFSGKVVAPKVLSDIICVGDQTYRSLSAISR